MRCCSHLSEINDVVPRAFHSTNYPTIHSFDPGEDWGWCYVDELFFESFQDRSRPSGVASSAPRFEKPLTTDNTDYLGRDPR
jgi:hypothetical protein